MLVLEIMPFMESSKKAMVVWHLRFTGLKKVDQETINEEDLALKKSLPDMETGRKLEFKIGLFLAGTWLPKLYFSLRSLED